MKDRRTKLLDDIADFVPDKQFAVETCREAGLHIVSMGKKFRETFLKMPRQSAPSVLISAERFVIHDEQIVIHAMRQRRELCLAHLHALLAQQGNGREGFLLVNGYANFCHIKDGEGVALGIDASWHAGGWELDASEDAVPSGWMTDIQILWSD